MEPSALETVVAFTERPTWEAIIRDEFVHGWRWETIQDFWGPVYPLSLLITLAFIVGILYCGFRIITIRRIEYAQFHKHAHSIEAEDVPRTQLRWARVMEHATSGDEHQWRLAILEADIMLNELLDLKGFKGETMAEKMKRVNPSDFHSIDDAWEAHKVRNKVAHEGSESPLTEREKNRVIGLYKRVFEEFGFIS